MITNFGINEQAIAVLALLPDKEYYSDRADLWLEVKPWYNGRERGIVLTVGTYGANKYLHIAFYEHRNSDSICCLKWQTKLPYWNHPLEDPNIFEVAYGKGKNKYDTAASFGYGKCGDCSQWITTVIREFIETLPKKQDK